MSKCTFNSNDFEIIEQPCFRRAGHFAINENAWMSYRQQQGQQNRLLWIKQFYTDNVVDILLEKFFSLQKDYIASLGNISWIFYFIFKAVENTSGAKKNLAWTDDS